METSTQQQLFEPSQFKPYDESQEPIFPPELKLKYDEFNLKSLHFKSKEMMWFKPADLTELLSLKEQYPDAKIVVGNTELGVEMKFKNCRYPVMIQPSQVTTLQNQFRNSSIVRLFMVLYLYLLNQYSNSLKYTFKLCLCFCRSKLDKNLDCKYTGSSRQGSTYVIATSNVCGQDFDL